MPLSTPAPTRLLPRAIALLCAGSICLALGSPAWALSEIKREELPAPNAPVKPSGENSPKAVPAPQPVTPAKPAPVTPAETQPVAPQAPAEQPAAPEAEQAPAPVPDIQYDLSKLPPEVARMRQLLLDACKTGDIEKLRPLLGTGDDATQISLQDQPPDPIAYLKSQSGDDQGQEILAIMEEILEAGFVHLDAGTAEDLYVWPYFFGVPLTKLTPPQKVELFRIVTAGDYDEMKTFGSYIFYRIGITPQGRVAFFVAGE